MTPPPGADGGLLNAIVGSLIMTVLAVLIGTPVGILAGTYMAEYGRHDRLTSVVRFINDILLSAPSIVVGLFIYEVMVVKMGHFSAWAGAVALAVIVLPVVVRTTEDMLLLVPEHAARSRRGARHAARRHHPQGLLPRGADRHDHRRAARGRPHQRRDRAAAVHRRSTTSSGARTSTRRWPTCRSSSSSSRSAPMPTGRSWPGPARCSLRSVCSRSVSRRARLPLEETAMNVASVAPVVASPTVVQHAADRRRPDGEDFDPRPEFLLRRQPGAQGHQPAAVREARHRLHRAVGLREVDAAARAQPHVRPLSATSARKATSRSTARTSCRRSRTSTCCARASAWCSRSRRRSRCRSTRTSPSACGSTRSCRSPSSTARVEQSLRRAALWEEVKDKLATNGLEPVRRPAAAALHRAHRRGEARGHPARRAVLGARSDLDRQDRGADRRAARPTTRS